MTKGLTDVAKIVAEKNNISEKAAREIIHSALDTVTEMLKSGDDVTFKNLVSFKVVEKPERTANVFGEKKVIPAHKDVKAVASKALRECVK